MKIFFILLILFSFIDSNSYAKNKKNNDNFFSDADKNNDLKIDYSEFENQFKSMDKNGDNAISKIEYKNYWKAKNTKIKKLKKEQKNSKIKKNRKKSNLNTKTSKNTEILSNTKDEEPVVTEPTTESNETPKEDLEILDSIKEAE